MNAGLIILGSSIIGAAFGASCSPQKTELGFLFGIGFSVFMVGIFGALQKGTRGH